MLKPILLVEDNPKDLELTLIALERSQLANDVIVVEDGAEALDYLYRRNAYAGRGGGHISAEDVCAFGRQGQAHGGETGR